MMSPDLDRLIGLQQLDSTIDDARLFLSVTQGPDDRDIQSIPGPLALDGPQPGSVKGMKLALNIDIEVWGPSPIVPQPIRPRN